MTTKPTKTIPLKVQEALQEEAYKGIVRVDSQTMRQIDVKPGDIIEIEGGRKTIGIVDRAYPSDIGQSIIRMDGIIRRNAKTGIGETVKVGKAEVREAKSVTIAPAQQGVMIQANPTIFKQGLLGRAVLKGDILSLGGTRRRKRTLTGSPFEDIFSFDMMEDFMGNFGFGSLKFIVADTNPPSPVTGLSMASSTDQILITLNWSPNKETDVSFYNIYRSDGAFDSVTSLRPIANSTGTQVKDANLLEGHDYYYAVTPVDVSGNENTDVESIHVVTADITPPVVSVVSVGEKVAGKVGRPVALGNSGGAAPWQQDFLHARFYRGGRAAPRAVPGRLSQSLSSSPSRRGPALC